MTDTGAVNGSQTPWNYLDSNNGIVNGHVPGVSRQADTSTTVHQKSLDYYSEKVKESEAAWHKKGIVLRSLLTSGMSAQLSREQQANFAFPELGIARRELRFAEQLYAQLPDTMTSAQLKQAAENFSRLQQDPNATGQQIYSARITLEFIRNIYRPDQADQPQWESSFTAKERDLFIREQNKELEKFNRLAIAFAGPVFGSPAAIGRQLGAAPETVQNLLELGFVLGSGFTPGLRTGRIGTPTPKVQLRPNSQLTEMVLQPGLSLPVSNSTRLTFATTNPVSVSGSRAIDRGRTYEVGVRNLYGEVPFSQRQFEALVDGKWVSGVADNIVTIGGKSTAIEAKFVDDWATSIRNPASDNGGRSWALAEQRNMLSQARNYSAAFDKIIYHTNSADLARYYSRVFTDANIDNFKFVITPATRP